MKNEGHYNASIPTSREWYNVELSEEDAQSFRWFLQSWMISNPGIDFETSEAGNLIHFECSLSEEEFKKVDKWLEDWVRN